MGGNMVARRCRSYVYADTGEWETDGNDCRPALAGLASGDIASMAYNMQIAFATTVVGLVAGAVGFLTQQVKQRWYLQDMTNLEFIAELLNENRTTKTTEK